MISPTHRMTMRVRYAEVNRLGRLHTSCCAVYLEMGRTEMLRATGMTYRDFEEAGAYLVVVRLGMTFHAPARYDDVLTLETAVTRATGVRIDHHYRLLREGVLLAEADTVLACVSRQGQVRRIPAALLSVLGVD